MTWLQGKLQAGQASVPCLTALHLNDRSAVSHASPINKNQSKLKFSEEVSSGSLRMVM